MFAPAMRGKVGMPEVSTFDPLTGLALPMLEVASELKSFSKDTAPAQELAAALPTLPLTAATAVTPTLQAIIQAHQQADAKAAQDASDGHGAANPGWLDRAGDLLDGLKSASATTPAAKSHDSMVETLAREATIW